MMPDLASINNNPYYRRMDLAMRIGKNSAVQIAGYHREFTYGEREAEIVWVNRLWLVFPCNLHGKNMEAKLI
jgi:hypothetical protein